MVVDGVGTHRMTVDVLSYTVHHNIRSKIQRILDIRTEERIVNHNHDSMLMGDRSHIADINQPQSWVTWTFDPNELGLDPSVSVITDHPLDVDFEGRRESHFDAMSGGHLGEVAMRATVDVRDGNYMRARGE